mgnify:CR=1 FL=1
MMKSDLDDLAAESAQSADLAKRTALGIGGAIALVFIGSMIAGYVSVVIENGGPSLTDIGIISAMAAAAALVAYGLWRLWNRTNPAEHPATGPGEVRTRQRNRTQMLFIGVAAIMGAMIGLATGIFGDGDGSLFAGNWEDLKLPPLLAIGLAVMLLVAFLALPLYGFGLIDDYKREHNFVAFTGGCLSVLAGFPVWAVLHAGGFVPPPHAFGIFAIAYVSMLVSFLYARWRL